MGKVHYLLTQLDIGRSPLFNIIGAIHSYFRLIPANPESTC